MRAGATLQRAARGTPHVDVPRTRRIRRLAVVAVVALSSGACGGAERPTTTSQVPANFPTAAVRVWLEAVAQADLAEIDRVVERRGEAVVVALENGFDADQLAAAATGGLPDDLADQYWRSFREAFDEFDAGSLAAVEVGEFEEITADGRSFAFVDVTGTQGAARIVTRLASNGQWQVDLVGTLASALSTQFGTLPELTGTEEARAVLFEVIADAVLPSLELVASQPDAAADVEEAVDVLQEAVDSA